MILASAALVAVAVWLLVRPVADRRVADRRVAGRSGRPAAPAGATLARWGPRAAAVVAAVAAWLLVGGLAGALVAVLVVVAVPRMLGRLEPRSHRARREALARQAPLLADLLAATLASGATVRAALGAAAEAVGEPAASTLRPVVTAMDLGADPAAWREARATAGANDDPLRPVLDAVARSAASGAPASRVLTRLAADLRRERRVVVEVAARSAGVRAVAPLAACFLPAFVLLGVVPVVASLAGSVLG